MRLYTRSLINFNKNKQPKSKINLTWSYLYSNALITYAYRFNYIMFILPTNIEHWHETGFSLVLHPTLPEHVTSASQGRCSSRSGGHVAPPKHVRVRVSTPLLHVTEHVDHEDHELSTSIWLNKKKRNQINIIKASNWRKDNIKSMLWKMLLIVTLQWTCFFFKYRQWLY